MFKNLNLTQKQKIIFCIGGSILLLVLLFFIYQSNQTLSSSDLLENTSILQSPSVENSIVSDSLSPETILENISDSVENANIIIHITGHIINPGIVHLLEGARIHDAIEAAGGADTEADLENINLAYPLEDGQKLYIPSRSDIEKWRKQENSQKEISTDRYISEDAGDTVVIEEQGASKFSPSSAPSSSHSNISKGDSKMININTATQTELETLPGIGPSTALKILNYRKENGTFHSIDEIKNVKGIGDSKFANIKDYITVK